MGTVDNQQGQDIDDDWVRERKKEFQEVIDADRNGIVTMEELEVGNVGGSHAHAAGRSRSPPQRLCLSRRSTWTR